jgi:[ribosomal protein S5]-alanine N-acetyltransferase
VPELQRLQAGHAPAVLAFELANRAYFAAFISDRGDEFFDQFTDRFRTLLAEQDDGIGAFYVLVAADGSVLGRFNLLFTGDGAAELGYRVAQHAAGRGVATATVRELGRLAAARHGLRTLRAATSSQEGTGQSRIRPGRPGRPGPSRRQARHLVSARPSRRRRAPVVGCGPGPGWRLPR